MSILKRLFSGGKSAPKSAFDAPIAPDTAFYAIGDIHGVQHRLTAALADIDSNGDDAIVVFVGDYVDRGEQSADVLRTIKERQERLGPSFVCLMGNHEEMLLNFLEDPERHGERWLRYGGLQTIASFGVGIGGKRDFVAMRDRLADAMGEDLIRWIRNLPCHWTTGNVTAVHAGANPEMAISEQEKKTLLWGHPDFDSKDRSDGVWVVHGHTIVEEATAKYGRISTDTGAYATGRLTVAHVRSGAVDFKAY